MWVQVPIFKNGYGRTIIRQNSYIRSQESSFQSHVFTNKSRKMGLDFDKQLQLFDSLSRKFQYCIILLNVNAMVLGELGRLPI